MISNFTIAGWGSYRPRTLLTSRALDERQGQSPGWTERQFGIAARHVANEEETTSMMATEAAREALNRAGWGSTPPDVIIGGCGVMEQPIPSTAALVQNRLGFGQSGVPSFDVNQTCLSFMVALDIAAMGIACGAGGARLYLRAISRRQGLTLRSRKRAPSLAMVRRHWRLRRRQTQPVECVQAFRLPMVLTTR